MSNKDNTVDLFSKKSLDTIEAEEKELKDNIDTQFNEQVYSVLDQIKELVDEGKLNGFFFGGLIEDGVLRPNYSVKSGKELPLLSVVTKSLSDDVQVGAEMQYGLLAGLEDLD